MPVGTSAATHSFRALRHRNFRLFVVGQFISLIGTWMQTVALGWLIYRLTHSPFLLGLAGFLGQIPSLFFSPLAGVLADRWNRHRMVIGTQVLFMAQALALAALVLSGKATIPEILGLNLLLGFISAADVPARQSFMIELVPDPRDLPNAIALNSSVFNVARLVGPSIAGVVIGLLSEGLAFLLNGLSYVAVIGALLAIRVPPRARRAAAAPNVWAHLAEGLRYAGGFAPIRAALLLLALVGLVGTPFSVLMPMFASDVLGGGAHTLGFLVASIGLGALAGALFLARRRTVRGLGSVIVWAVSAFGAGLIALALARTQWLACGVLAVVGFGMMVHMASTNTILQTLVDPDKRGRVMSLYTVAFMGTMPLGSLAAGALAGRLGAPLTVALGGAACLVAGALFARELPALRAQVRPIYERLGIAPEVATGIQASEEPPAPS
ncbi:MFS transporter [Anaeromyxobacter paludicola]|uniref:MFS transporter n=1 Tax=Anaeromyxobacter paludicola TaxID=2918171 RepID=A0ABM7XD86_9BACT|nr:MFS transporter [Anaeromyxobacter paludicola]BDG09777.1 MFS transporter [Anaeromyxobacter paludicola]